MKTETTKSRAAAGRVELEVSPERVWQALTDAAELVRWFPLEARVEPGEGGSVWMSWKNEYAGESRILAWEPPRRLAISWGWSEEEATPQVTEYRIEARGGVTIVDVVTSGFPEDPSWDAFVEGTTRGWLFELRSLKQYLEGHDGEDRDVVYLRRRTPVGAREAWMRVFGREEVRAGVLRGLRVRTTIDETEGSQYAAVLDEPAGALLRVSLEPCGIDPDSRDVTLWLQAWGDARATLPEHESRWRPLLERLFPEGATP